jgi:TonB family protein
VRSSRIPAPSEVLHVPPVSQPPPSNAIPGKSGGSAPYVLGVLVLAALIGGLICWKSKDDQGGPKPPDMATAQAATTQPEPVHAPPPPPPIEEDAGVEDAGGKPANAGTTKGGTGTGGCGGKCGDGQSSPALNSALSSTAQSAQGCYNRALRTSEVSGAMTVSVQVGPQGQVCSANIANDSVGSGEISSCVLGRFRGKSFPPPKSGCVVVNIPISFKLKQ